MQNTTRQYSREDIQMLLRSNDMAVVRGISALYARQTTDEQQSESTNHNNKRGFNGTDAKILTSFAKQIDTWRRTDPDRRYVFPLSPKQLGLARRMIFKYSGQLALVANEKAAAVEQQAALEAAAERVAIQEVETEIEDESLALV